MKCPNCGSDSSGAFCADCGTPLKGARCKECNATLTSGANYCTNCGTAARGAAAAKTSPAWYVAGAALVVLIAALLWPAITGQNDEGRASDGKVPISQIQDAGDEATTPPQLTGTPREQADRLFNRVMTERANGDTTQAKFFLPMAIQAYGMAGELDADGLYHLSLLQSLNGDNRAARETAERILAAAPTHLLGLGAAADAARASGDAAAARNYYERLLAAYDSESKRDLPEYRDHGRIFPDLKAAAEAYAKN